LHHRDLKAQTIRIDELYCRQVCFFEFFG
jgi:hypothetical protein